MELGGVRSKKNNRASNEGTNQSQSRRSTPPFVTRGMVQCGSRYIPVVGYRNGRAILPFQNGGINADASVQMKHLYLDNPGPLYGYVKGQTHSFQRNGILFPKTSQYPISAKDTTTTWMRGHSKCISAVKEGVENSKTVKEVINNEPISDDECPTGDYKGRLEELIQVGQIDTEPLPDDLMFGEFKITTFKMEEKQLKKERRLKEQAVKNDQQKKQGYGQEEPSPSSPLVTEGLHGSQQEETRGDQIPSRSEAEEDMIRTEMFSPPDMIIHQRDVVDHKAEDLDSPSSPAFNDHRIKPRRSYRVRMQELRQSRVDLVNNNQELVCFRPPQNDPGCSNSSSIVTKFMFQSCKAETPAKSTKNEEASETKMLLERVCAETKRVPERTAFERSTPKLSMEEIEKKYAGVIQICGLAWVLDLLSLDDQSLNKKEMAIITKKRDPKGWCSPHEGLQACVEQREKLALRKENFRKLTEATLKPQRYYT